MHCVALTDLDTSWTHVHQSIHPSRNFLELTDLTSLPPAVAHGTLLPVCNRALDRPQHVTPTRPAGCLADLGALRPRAGPLGLPVAAGLQAAPARVRAVGGARGDLHVHRAVLRAGVGGRVHARQRRLRTVLSLARAANASDPVLEGGAGDQRDLQ